MSALGRGIIVALVATTLQSQITAGQSALRSMPRLHHVGLNSVDPEKAIAWYLEIWPSAKRTTVAGFPAVQADMLVLFNKVDRPPPGAWRNDLHRAEPQSAFWHIGANTNTTDTKERLNALGAFHLPLYVMPGETTKTVWRSGLAPYTGTLSASQLANAQPAAPRDGGFSYVVARAVEPVRREVWRSRMAITRADRNDSSAVGERTLRQWDDVLVSAAVRR